jgi:hypothetical protein
LAVCRATDLEARQVGILFIVATARGKLLLKNVSTPGGFWSKLTP